MIISNSNCPNVAALSFGRAKEPVSSTAKVNIPYSESPKSVSGKCASGLINFVELTNEINNIKKVKEIFLANKDNAVSRDDLERVRGGGFDKSDSPEERLLKLLLFDDIYCLNGKPYTGYTSEEGEIFQNFDNGSLTMTFFDIKDKGIMGYTDEKNASSKYCRITPEQKTLITSKYVDDACYVKVINIDKNGSNVNSYRITENSIDNPDMQKFANQLNKYFDGEIDDSLVVFS